MPRLTAAQVKQEASRRTDKVRSLPDGQGLLLRVPPEGEGRNAYWVQRISRGSKETMRGIGPYPKVKAKRKRWPVAYASRRSVWLAERGEREL